MEAVLWKRNMNWKPGVFVLLLGLIVLSPSLLYAQDEPAERVAPQLSLEELVQAGGAIGFVILLLSIAMIALIVEHALTIRRKVLMPVGLAEKVHQHLTTGQLEPAKQVCREEPSFLASLLLAGLNEVGLGYAVIEKSMEDASVQQASRLYRKIEYLSLISSIAPMLGLLGTVWGMIQAFLEFTVQENPLPSELAPGIYRALVTTLLGLGVAVPALASFAIFRNRIDELVAETSLMAEHVFSSWRRAQLKQKPSSASTRVVSHPDEA
ncbi:MAG: MotA/TolQ/ExbB proton channel family protein [Planctomycetaceae bacterium]|nr:MotA/TolQ/ExbB proton channel family protein [Planctomycetaceae bacterium]